MHTESDNSSSVKNRVALKPLASNKHTALEAAKNEVMYTFPLLNMHTYIIMHLSALKSYTYMCIIIYNFLLSSLAWVKEQWPFAKESSNTR